MSSERDKRKERCPVCKKYFNIAILTDEDLGREFLICYNCSRYYYRAVGRDLNPKGEWIYIDRFGKSEGIDLSQVFKKGKRDKSEKRVRING